MAIAFDTSAHITPAASNSVTLSHTCTGSNLALVVGVTVNNNSDSVTGVTYNGVSMTKAVSSARISGARFHYVYILLAPTSGTHNIVASSSASNIESVMSASYTGVNQSTYDTTGGPGSVASNILSLAITTTTDNDWIAYLCVMNSFPGTPTNMTQREDSTAGFYMFDTNGVVHPAGSYTASITAAGLSDGGLWGVSLKPFGTTNHSLSLLGVGV